MVNIFDYINTEQNLDPASHGILHAYYNNCNIK